MKSKFLWPFFLLIFILSCVPAPSGPESARNEAMGISTDRPKVQTWETEWQRVQEEARKEGKLMIMGEESSEVKKELISLFRDKYGIALEYTGGRGAELATKLLGERRAGLFSHDIWQGGIPTQLTVLKPEGALEPMNNILILPEVLDKKVWWNGELPFIDPEHTIGVFQVAPQYMVSVNTELVKDGEVKTYQDILSPKWKGKIVINDPTVRGAGNAWFASLAVSPQLGLDYLRALVKQEPAITRDQRLMVEWVARGKHLISLAGLQDEVTSFIKAGAPLKYITSVEVTTLEAGTSAFGLINKGPHPNAAKFFINWLLSKEGGSVYTRANATHSAREDVSTERVDPSRLRLKGLNYLNALTPEFKLRQVTFLDIAKDVFSSVPAK